jgi:hypothetical protein
MPINLKTTLIFAISLQLFYGCNQNTKNLESTSIKTPVPIETSKPIETINSSNNFSTKEDINDPSKVKDVFLTKIKDDISKLNLGLKNLVTKHKAPGYTYKAEYAGKYSYDIQKTDSIVSPYLGLVKYRLNWYANEKLFTDIYIEATYAYQDGKWIFKDAARKSDTVPEIKEAVNYLFE